MCSCESSDRLFVPACDYIWAVARWDAGDRLWRLTVTHSHSGQPVRNATVAASATSSAVASLWLSSAVGELLGKQTMTYDEC